ncbi:MAG: right-handed parallel beta-helix repeat-containing protein [Kiritimatiellia bacterium]
MTVRVLSSLALLMAAVSATAGTPAPHPARAVSGCPDFTVEKPRERGGDILNAASFGFSTASDKNAAAINRALAEARRIGARGIELAPGTYRCFDEDGIVIEKMTDFTFDGKGAVLVFRRPAEYRGQPQSEIIMNKSNLFVSNCERVWVKNLTMDWDWQNDPLCDAGIVAAKHIDRDHPEESYIEFVLPDWERHPKYPEPVPIQKMQRMPEDRSGFCVSEHFYFGQTEGHFGAKNEWVAPNRLRMWPGVPMPGRNQNPQTGYRLRPLANLKDVERVNEGELYRILHCYYGKNGVCMLGNRHATISDVTVWSCFGMAMVTDGPQEYWRVERFRVVPPTEREFAAAYPGVPFFKRLMTSSSDGHHIARSNGHCQYVDCLWTLNNDDSNNFHDRFTIAVKCGAKKLHIINRRGYNYFRAARGTEIELRKPNFDKIGSSPLGFRAKLAGIAGEILILDKDIPEQTGPCFLVWDRSYGTDNVLLKGCKLVDSGFRNLFSSSNLTIEDCEFIRTGNYPIRLIGDYQADFWCEGMGVTNVVIRGCRFEDPCVSFPGAPVISSVCVTPPGWEIDAPDKGFVAGDVLVDDCRFIRPKGPVIDFSTGRNVMFRNSTIDLKGVDTKAYPQAGAIVADKVDGFTSENISVVGTDGHSDRR